VLGPIVYGNEHIIAHTDSCKLSNKQVISESTNVSVKSQIHSLTLSAYSDISNMF